MFWNSFSFCSRVFLVTCVRWYTLALFDLGILAVVAGMQKNQGPEFNGDGLKEAVGVSPGVSIKFTIRTVKFWAVSQKNY